MHFFFGVLIFAALIAAMLGLVVVKVIQILKGGQGVNSGASDPQEAQLIQELHQGLGRMEERINALETILLEKGYQDKEQS